ncbi:MAG: hypothetical protein EKK55_00030, partial [Rhodocyclaceae bacterium]
RSLAEISELMDISRERARQLEASALAKVHKALRLEGAPSKSGRDGDLHRLRRRVAIVPIVDESGADGDAAESDGCAG